MAPTDNNDNNSYSTLGSILLAMNAVSEHTLQKVLAEQAQLTEVYLGDLLVKKGYITPIQLHDALKKQRQIRSKKRYQQSMATADLAINRHRRISVINRRERVLKKGEETVKKITGDEHLAVKDTTDD